MRARIFRETINNAGTRVGLTIGSMGGDRNAITDNYRYLQYARIKNKT